MCKFESSQKDESGAKQATKLQRLLLLYHLCCVTISNGIVTFPKPQFQAVHGFYPVGSGTSFHCN